MKELVEEFTISVFTENLPGLTQRVVSTFTRRHINILSLTTSKSSMKGIHRFTIVVELPEERVRKVVASLDRQVDVVKAFYYHIDEVIQQEVALYKVPTKSFLKSNVVEKLVRKHNARIMRIEADFIIIEKTGHQAETESLLEELREYGLLEFARSGLVALPNYLEPLNNYLNSIDRIEIINQN